jgi:hypothetical protein
MTSGVPVPQVEGRGPRRHECAMSDGRLGPPPTFGLAPISTDSRCAGTPPGACSLDYRVVLASVWAMRACTSFVTSASGSRASGVNRIVPFEVS